MHASKEPEIEPSGAMRRALSHILGESLIDYLPGTLLGLSELTDEGFQADFVLPRALSPEDFPELERRMRARLESGAVLECLRVPAEQGIAWLRERNEPYQLAEAEQRARSDATLLFVRGTSLLALCDAPRDCLLASLSGAGAAFELRSVAGAYFRGDAANVMMTRVQAWAFETQAELDAARERHEHALQRDHKRIGRELELFAFDDAIGAGLPLWLPNGTALRDELEGLMRELEFEAGFERVATPHLAHKELYERTGHLPYFADSMFPLMQRPGEHSPVFALRPMNCPHHHRIFATRKRSYRELPLRLSEYGHVYRYEDSGAVSGLLRTRCMCMNDGHIYCAKEQVSSELHAVLDMHERVYGILGLSDYRVRLSTHGAGQAAQDKFVDDPAGWELAESMLREVLEARGMAYFEGPGEAAFYGPKIDFQFRMVTGREETASTLQLDFAVAKRLDLTYVGPAGDAVRPFILHRAPLGTHERFVALLIERYAGAFPTWLAPVQACVLPVSDEFEPYAREVQQALRALRIRAQLEPAEHSLSKRIRRAVQRKVPHVLVVGERERAERTVTRRRYGTDSQHVLPLTAACSDIAGMVAARTLDA
jgi:threonyl-tRNA synthetase